ncbi:MAG: PDZ domain-containing protein [Planctomycetes bacterium]|nr:PDZ domain-containing protein [Planctomycetota bacterium]
MSRFNALRCCSKTALGLLMTGSLAGVVSAADPPPAPVEQQDVVFSVAHPVAITRPATIVRPLMMMLAAPAPENVAAPVAGAQAGTFSIAVEGAPPAEEAAPPLPPAPGGVIRAPILQRFVPQGAVQIVHAAAAMETGKFWLGMMCQPAPEVLRTQMALPAGTGLVVHQIVPEGPAAKAGLQRNDVLLQADGQPLPDAAALGKVANEKGAVAIDFNILRGGKAQTLKVTPAERPAQPFNVLVPQGDDHQAIEQWIEHLRQLAADRQAAGPGRPLRLRILRPAQVAGAVPQRPFPADLNVKVTREGNNPTKIEVRQGEKTWQITSDDLAKLPETIRPHIEAMLGNMTAGRAVGNFGVVEAEAFQAPGVQIQGSAEFEAPSVEGAPPVGAATAPAPAVSPLPPPLPTPPAPGVQKNRGAEIDQLRGQLKELQRRMDQLGEEK